jgi:serine/threonine-protein kinase
MPILTATATVLSTAEESQHEPPGVPGPHERAHRGRRRRPRTIEIVEGDDDLTGVDRRAVFTYAVAAVAAVAAIVIAVVAYRVLSTPSYAVPDLIGRPAAQVANEAAGYGWTVSSRHERSDSEPQGAVVSTEPPAGDKLDRGSVLVIVVSDGPTLATLPDVTGLSVDDARAKLSALGLSMSVGKQLADPTAPAGTVLSWSVSAQAGLVAGSQVPRGTDVVVVVSSGPAPVAVPTLAGLTVSGATAKLDGVGLVVGTVNAVNSATVPVGAVVSSDPPAGTQVAHGDTVDLTVSEGPELVAVPNLIGLTPAQATQALAGVGLALGPVTGKPNGTVVSTTPSPGASAPRNAKVALVLG